MNTQSTLSQPVNASAAADDAADFDFDAIDDEAIAEAKFNVPTINALLESHINKHTVSGEVWPDDAVYMARYRLKAWPTQEMDHVSFFPSAEALQKWYAAQCKWATYEDNYFMFDDLYMWDWGPVRIDDTEPHVNPH